MSSLSKWFAEKSIKLQEDPAYSGKILKVLDLIIKQRKDLAVNKLSEEAVQLFCSEFPEDKYVLDYKEGKDSARAILTTAIRNLIRGLDMNDYLAAFGIDDHFIFPRLKEIASQSENLNAAKAALDTLLKIMGRLTDTRVSSGSTANTQYNIKEATFYTSGAHSKEEALRDLIKDIDKLKTLSEEKKLE